MNEVNPNAYIVGEVWENSAVSVGAYLNKAFDSGFNFALGEALVNSAKTDDQNRVMSQLEGNTEHAKMAAAMLLTLPGNPFIYCGEEIGMFGVKPDEGIREPMGWYGQGSGEGQPTWEARSINQAGGSSVVDVQSSDGDSLLQYYLKLIEVRNTVPALQKGTIRDYESVHKCDFRTIISVIFMLL